MMKILIIKAFSIFIAGITVLLISCTPQSCFEETNAFVKAFFYSTAKGKALAPDSLTLYGVGLSTKKIYKKAGGVVPALIPLNSSSENCSFVVRINGISDTMIFSYTSYPHLISKECGYTFYHRIDTPVYTKHIIDKVKILNSSITTINEENIRIYY
jgi:hypothetical protein